jgi:hypothetical protein
VDDTQTYYGELMDDLALGNMAHQMGTDLELAKAYNAGDQAKKDALNWNQFEADKWWDDAAPEDIASQYDAAKEARSYKIAEKSVGWGMDYKNHENRDIYADTSKLPRDKLNAVLNSTVMPPPSVEP